MQNDGQNLSERLLDFGAAIVILTPKLNKTIAARHIGNQLMRSGTSCGANYEEACAAESRADFVHKMQIVLKKLRESLYWLRLAKKSQLTPDSGIAPIFSEADELVKIFARSVITAKGRSKKP